jgi:hypothetical protein
MSKKEDKLHFFAKRDRDGIDPEIFHVELQEANRKMKEEPDNRKYWVDIPIKECVQDEDTSWVNLGEFSTREAAIEFIQKYIDPMSKDGTINLITEGEA